MTIEAEELTKDRGEDGSELELLDIDPDTEIISTTYDITSYGADFDVDGLIRRMNRGDIVVPSFEPSCSGIEVHAFQRGFVWRKPQMSRFIESLLLALPVPGIFLVKDQDSRLLVLDGQQRLRTLQQFYEQSNQPFRLTGVQEPWNGVAYAELRPEDRRRLDDSILHATILRDESAPGSQDAVYSIYERLNTGGSPLQPQEIRIALYPGPLLSSLATLNQTPAWRALYGPTSARFKDHELILRILALFADQAEYEKPLKTFLNRFLSNNQSHSISLESHLGSLFTEACETLKDALGWRAFRPDRVLNVALADALMVGLMHRIDESQAPSANTVAVTVARLLENPAFVQSITSQTSDVNYVNKRLDLATDAFRRA